MGVLKPRAGNANYSTAGQLSPLLNDPYYLSLGLGTRIFLGGAVGHVLGPGTQHNPHVKRGKNGVPLRPAGTLMVMGKLKEMDPKWLAGASMLGYGCSLVVGIGVPIPIINEEMARYTGVSDGDLSTQIIDYGTDYPKGEPRNPLTDEELFDKFVEWSSLSKERADEIWITLLKLEEIENISEFMGLL